MSYNFDFRTASKTAAKQRIVQEMQNVVDQQPCHHKDLHAAIVVAHAYIDMLADKSAYHDLQVNVHGSVGYEWSSDDPYAQASDALFTSASVGVSAFWVARTTQED